MKLIIESLDVKKYILIKGARVHNLKNIDIAIPRNKLVVITGVSGSGKSSLAFDTLFAEGQRRYVESLSSYARQFLHKMEKPEIDYIKGISPAIAIEQKVNSRNPRSTVGTATELYEYIKLLFARIGQTYSPISNQLVKRHSVTDVVDFINDLEDNTHLIIYAPLFPKEGRTFKDQLQILIQQGFSRVKYKDEILRIDELLNSKLQKSFTELSLVIDRIQVKKNDDENNTRLGDSVQTAFYEGSNSCIIEIQNKNKESKNVIFTNRFELDGIDFEEPSPAFFAFNNPYGACKRCEGFGSIIGIDENLVIPNKNLSVFEEAIVCWKGEKMSEWKDELVMNAYKFNFPIHRPIYELTEKEINLLWNGNKYFGGINNFFKWVEEQTYKIQYRVMLARYRGKTVCPECLGTRLRADAGYVKINTKSIINLVLMPIKELIDFFKQLKLTDNETQISKRLLIEITNRLGYLHEVGLGYLTLNRTVSTLSGGETQRMNLATSLGSSLVGSMYLLDEPSIGLHPRDTHQLIKVLQKLKFEGNTVIIVEHDEEIMRAADYIIDIGPLAGKAGGEVIFQGTHEAILKEKESITAKYLNKEYVIETPAKRRKWKEYIEITAARENNLKGIDAKIPLGVLTVVTGVSGSGKSSLVKNILFHSLNKIFGGTGERTGLHSMIQGDIKMLTGVEFVDQNPIGRSSRSNPVTYVKAYDEIRDLFASQQLAKVRGYTPGYFSFNVPGGRCDTCEGDGFVTIEMQFMADLQLVCDECKGKRFKDEVLEIKYNEKDISEILAMTVDEALIFFADIKVKSPLKKIVDKLKPLSDVGLGYVQLGQASSTLSGGEAQRVKLASFLNKNNLNGHLLFIFDEPTTGLHFHDIKKLLYSLNALIDQGHSVLIIEHNPDVIKCADWVIDLGPEGGNKGGYIIFEGIPEDLIKCNESYTGTFLIGKI